MTYHASSPILLAREPLPLDLILVIYSKILYNYFYFDNDQISFAMYRDKKYLVIIKCSIHTKVIHGTYHCRAAMMILKMAFMMNWCCHSSCPIEAL